MNELAWHKAFLDWLGRKGKVTEADLAEFAREIEAKKFIEDNFKGMF
jgi:hypothetical protein|tara:strand:- start:92 stop:232 length:141 start_codon:yes stop_codon:yes gene_type:complete